MLALKRKIGIRERELRQHHSHRRRDLFRIRNAENSPERIAHFLIVRIIGTELECIGLFHERQVLETERCLSRVV